MNLVEEMYNGSTTGVRTGCGVSAEFPMTVGLHHAGVSTEPFSGCGSGRDRREVTEKSGGKAGSIREQVSQSKGKLNRNHGMHAHEKLE